MVALSVLPAGMAIPTVVLDVIIPLTAGAGSATEVRATALVPQTLALPLISVAAELLYA